MADSMLEAALPLLLVGVNPLEGNDLTAALLFLGRPIVHVESLRTARAILDGVHPGIVVVFWVGGGRSQLADWHHWRHQPIAATLPVVCIGKDCTQRERLELFAIGIVDFIPVPYCVAEVCARVKVHLQGAERTGTLAQEVRTRLSRSPEPLLSHLQRALHQQAMKLHAQNIQLQREVQERQQVEQALRQEQHKSEKLLLNILPEAIVQQLKQVQGSLAERYDDATVLFADIVGFTPLAAEQSPLELVSLLNQIFSAFDRLVEKYNLEKIKTIGDAYMVVGGVPLPHPNHAIAVADMALDMMQVIQQFRRTDQTPLQLRIGIHTGSVVAGVIGIRKFSYDLWGDTVNLASRMESQGLPNTIQITSVTYERIQQQFVCKAAPAPIQVKGKGLMQTYYLLGRRSTW